MFEVSISLKSKLKNNIIKTYVPPETIWSFCNHRHFLRPPAGTKIVQVDENRGNWKIVTNQSDVYKRQLVTWLSYTAVWANYLIVC